jgi:signal transduction histidine kinase
LKAGETVFDAALESEATGAIESVKPGSVVSVTGIYAFQYGPPPSFRLLLRSPDDVVLVTAAPWWTLRHTLVVGLVVALVGSAAGLWVRIISHEHALARERYQAILNERSRLARELHDTLEQGLAGIKLQLEAVAGSVDGSPEVARHSLDVAREMLRYALNEARRSVLDLRSQALENGDLAGALSDLARQMTHGTPLTAEVRVVGAPRPLAASQEHHLLRIGLEALTNSIKHSGAAHIEIELHFGDGATELSVRDDGCGFAHDGVDTPAGHFGLRGIRERVDKLGGSLCLKSRPGDGTRLEVTVPLDPQRSQPFDQRVNDA